MASLNKVILIGNIVADPELKQTQSGISVTSFRIAVSRKYSSRNAEGGQQTDFINIVAWRNTAEFVSKYFSKGKSIFVCGSLQTRDYTDTNGQRRFVTEVVADEVSFVEKKSDSPNAPIQETPYGSSPKDVDFEEMGTDEDLPF